ncbi:MAG: MurT ligase domain-containing protein [Actinomycetota bacterium]|nr:MurT ligase domain-containing protein [Actinomycetota bacterium]
MPISVPQGESLQLVSGNSAKLSLRTRCAARSAMLIAGTSRALRRGSGTVIGGQVALTMDPHVLARLSAGRLVALVSGTNGKTTTTKLLAAAVGTLSGVVTNEGGANLPGGLVAALAGGSRGVPAVLEVDEGYLGMVAEVARPHVIVLLNLSRDQLDRVSEVRMQADKWRAALSRLASARVVANCDDPLVVWAAGTAGSVTWVAGGQSWRGDSAGCPSCDGHLIYDSGKWACGCGFSRPEPDAWVEDGVLRMKSSRPGFSGDDVAAWPIRLPLPGRCNLSNAAMAISAAALMGAGVKEALSAIASISEVAGRYSLVQVDGVQVRMLLAKNPAGWMELLELLEETKRPSVIAINARLADGQDPSWLWDVPFERLADRFVVASGDRCWDLAVRLTYANVPHTTVPELSRALLSTDGSSIDFAGNYTAFQDLRRYLAGRRPAVLGNTSSQTPIATGTSSPLPGIIADHPGTDPEDRSSKE